MEDKDKITKEYILDSIDDLCMNFFVYDRKNDEEMKFEDIQNAINSGEITIDDMVERFRVNCIDTLTDNDKKENDN